jgi:ring-1,2-phenylacetyl-CoA epoxidase subunit PaaE
VKAVDKGVFSVYANQQLKAGDTLDVMPPEGRFILRTHSDNQNNYIGFAAGSGITPILSILKAVLEDEPKSTFTLVYGNRSPQEAMFSSEISGLKQLYADRFTVGSIFSKTREEDALFGRIDRANVNFLLKNKLPFDRYDKYFLCGPESMIETVKELLQEKGVKQDDILFELFTSSQQPEEFAAQGDEVEVTIVLDDDTETFKMDKQVSILQAALDHGIEAPYSCQGGICSTCIARLTEGTAEMRKNQILTDAEVAEGFILTCQAHPTSNAIKVDYDDI